MGSCKFSHVKSFKNISHHILYPPLSLQIHEAVRAGHTEIVKYLIGRGVDKNVGTNRGLGFSPLKLARSYLGEEHGLVKYLIDIGSASFGPDL